MLYSVQFLRGIAALMVVMEHTAFKGSQYNIESLSWFHVGFTGVDLFFIISGFIMCYTTHNKNISFNKFLVNRFERILPLYWILTILALSVYLIAPHLINSSGGKTGIIESFFLIPNGNKFLIQNGWTLSYEFYYYFIFSLFLIITSTKILRYFSISLTLILLVILGYFTKPLSPLFNFLTNTLLIEFSYGIVAFLLFKKINIKFSLLLIIIGLLGITHLNISNNDDIYNNRAFYAGLPMFLIFIGLINLEFIFKKSKNMVFRFFESLGNSSYSLYLIHPFALSPTAIILNKLNITNNYIFTISLITTSLLAGYATYSIIEKNITNFFRKQKHINNY